MMRRVAHGTAILLGLAAGAAAVVTTSCDSLNGLSGGEGRDAAVSPDGPDEGGMHDSAPSPDAQADATPDAGTFCATHQGHTLCDDFDEPGFRDVWSGGMVVTGGGSLFQDPDASVSPPYSLGAEMPASPTGISSALTTVFEGLPNAINFSFDLWIVEAGSSGAAVAEVLLPSGQQFSIVLRGSGPVTLVLEEATRNADGGTNYDDVPGILFTLATGQWYPVTVALELAGSSGGMVSVKVGDAGPLSGVPTDLPMLMGTSVRLSTGVADYGDEPLGAWTVRLDNFIADLK
jgi:hypothetical protein